MECCKGKWHVVTVGFDECIGKKSYDVYLKANKILTDKIVKNLVEFRS